MTGRTSARDDAPVIDVAGLRASQGMLLEIEHLTKTYRGGVRANADVTLSVECGLGVRAARPQRCRQDDTGNQVVGLLRARRRDDPDRRP